MGGIPERKVRRVMAKKDNEFSYGASFLPEGEKKYSVIRWGWSGLNETDKIDTGQLTSDDGMICDPPYMIPAHKYKELVDLRTGIPYGSNTLKNANVQQGTPVSITAIDEKILLSWYDSVNQNMAVTQFRPLIGYWADPTVGFLYVDSFKTAPLATSSFDPNVMHTIVQFNAVDTSSGNVAEYTYDRKLLVYPECYSHAFSGTWSYDQASTFNTGGNTVPETEYATVYNSRVFGTNETAVHASAYNSYVDYSLDTADDISSAHAWYSLAQSNTDADSAVTAVTTFDNHVVVFRRDFMQLVYNNKNPFRIVDVGAFGCRNQKALTIMNGVLYFATNQSVYAYTGGTPKEISAKMKDADFDGAVLGSYNDTLWVQTDKTVYTYKDGTWSDLGKAPFGGASVKILQFATTSYGLVALADYSNGNNTSWGIILVDWDKEVLDPPMSDEAAWDPQYTGNWYFETDLMALGKLDIRRVKKFSMQCEGKKNATVSVFLFPDDDQHRYDAPDYKIGEITFDADGMRILRILTRQFSSTMHKLRFVGTGYVKIYAAEVKIAWGGDVYVEGQLS